MKRYRGKEPKIVLDPELVACLQGKPPWEYLKFWADDNLEGHPRPDDVDENAWSEHLAEETNKVCEIAGTYSVDGKTIEGLSILAVTYHIGLDRLTIRLHGYSKKGRQYWLKLVLDRLEPKTPAIKRLSVYRFPKPTPRRKESDEAFGIGFE